MYAIYDQKAQQYWNGKYKTTGGYVSPTLTSTQYLKSRFKPEPHVYKTKEAAEKGLEIMLNNTNEILKNNYDFVVVNYS